VSELERHVKIHQLKKEVFSIASIDKKCDITRNTVYSDLEKDLVLGSIN